jgi:4a-hydroxytetrahydrobiopterin dehydratase
MGGIGVSLPDWKRRDDARLAKTFLFPDFASALAFVNRVGAIAEEQGHHPDIHLAWGRVDVETWSHDTGGITDRDLRLAEAIDRVFSAK